MLVLATAAVVAVAGPAPPDISPTLGLTHFGQVAVAWAFGIGHGF